MNKEYIELQERIESLEKIIDDLVDSIILDDIQEEEYVTIIPVPILRKIEEAMKTQVTFIGIS